METKITEPKPVGAPRSRARAGDWVVVHGHRVGEPERQGLILEVLGEPGDERYRVRWDETRESIFYPGSDAAIRTKPHL